MALWLALPSHLHAEDISATQWLERLSHSMSELNYRGVMTYAHGSRLNSLRITHGRHEGEEFERIEHLDGAQREIIRYGKQLTCIQLGQRLDFRLHRHLLKAGLEGLDSHYDIRLAGEDRVAGRRAIVLAIQPRDQLRFGYRLTLDQETGLLLRSEALDEQDRVRERLQFVDVEIGMPLKKEWLGDIATAKKQSAAEAMSIGRVIEEAQMPWRPQWVPPGFALSVAPQRASDGVMTYSDGLAVLSVFVESVAPPLPSGDGKARQGATIAYMRPVELNGQPHLVTVVGEVPEITAQRVAASVAWDNPQP